MKKGFVKKDNNGISLVSLIITILVIIILAAISFVAFNNQNQATFAKFMQEFEEVRKGVESKRMINAKNDIENADYGFSRVYVSGDIPYNFISLDNDKNIETAYLVSLDYIGYDELTTGKDYPKFEQEGNNIKTVFFGKDDVYVYDSTGRLFYAKGFLNNGTKYFENAKDNSSIKITNVSTTKEGSSVKITITVESVNEVKSVKIGDNEANKIEDGKYEINVYKNGNYEIVAEDVEGQKDTEDIFVSGLETSGAPVVTAEVTNGILEDDVYKVHGKVAKIKLSSDTAKYLYIGNSVSDSPNSWLPFAQNIEKYYATSGEKDIYIYVKDENGVTSVNPYILHLLIELDEEVRPTEPLPENVEFGSISFLVTCSDPHTVDEYSRTKYLQISYPEGKQSNGYTSMYRLSTTNGGFGRWTISYDKSITLEITQETTVEAKIIYNKGNINKESNTNSILVDKIDRKIPTIKSLESIDDGKKTIIRGNGIDYESLLNDKPYLITLENIDFSNPEAIDVEKYNWEAATAATDIYEKEIIKDGKYYFYVRDKVNNVAVSSLNVDVVDRTPPEIKASEYGTPVLDYILIKAILTDETGVTEYAVTRDTSIPTEWIEINEQEYISIEYKVYDEGNYYVWAKDAAGNISEYKKVVAKSFKFPEIDSSNPKDLYVKEGDLTEYEVIITKDGDPAEYEFEWQYSIDSGEKWNTIAEAKNQKYSFTAKFEDNGKQYRCLIKNLRGTLISRVANLKVVRMSSDKPGIEVNKEVDMILGGIIINNGDEKTNESTLNLEIVALNATQMNISESSTKSTEWQAYEEKISYELKNKTPGKKTIYVWTRDSNGNESTNPVSAEITLEN